MLTGKSILKDAQTLVDQKNIDLMVIWQLLSDLYKNKNKQLISGPPTGNDNQVCFFPDKLVYSRSAKCFHIRRLSQKKTVYCVYKNSKNEIHIRKHKFLDCPDSIVLVINNKEEGLMKIKTSAIVAYTEENCIIEILCVTTAEKAQEMFVAELRKTNQIGIGSDFSYTQEELLNALSSREHQFVEVAPDRVLNLIYNDRMKGGGTTNTVVKKD